MQQIQTELNHWMQATRTAEENLEVLKIKSRKESEKLAVVTEKLAALELARSNTCRAVGMQSIFSASELAGAPGRSRSADEKAAIVNAARTALSPVQQEREGHQVEEVLREELGKLQVELQESQQLLKVQFNEIAEWSATVEKSTNENDRLQEDLASKQQECAKLKVLSLSLAACLICLLSLLCSLQLCSLLLPAAVLTATVPLTVAHYCCALPNHSLHCGSAGSGQVCSSRGKSNGQGSTERGSTEGGSTEGGSKEGGSTEGVSTYISRGCKYQALFLP